MFLIADGDQVAAGAEVDDALGEGRGGHAGFVHLVHGQDFEFGPCLDYVDVAAFAGEIDLAVGGDRGGGKRCAFFQPLAV